MGSALDEVSVDCADEASFERIEAEALERARRTPGRSASYAKAFLELQNTTNSAFLMDGRPASADSTDSRATSANPTDGTPTSADVAAKPRTYPVIRVIGFVLMWLFAPVLAAAAFAGSRADGRNTVTFFRILAGFGAVMVWVPALIVAAFFWPTIIGAGVLSGLLGWLLLGVRRIRL
jgi:hypothetical protein